MNSPRIVIDPNFALELHPPPNRNLELYSQAKYMLAFTDSRDCFFLNPNGSLTLQKSESTWLLIRMSPQALIETAMRLKLFRTGSNLSFKESRSVDPKLIFILSSIHNELLESPPGWQEVLTSLMQQLVVNLLRSQINLKRSEELELSRVGIVDRRLRRAIEFMHSNCQRELSLAEIASAAYLSEFHFARLFKRITGTPPHAYLAAIRIEQARKLLLETDLGIAEIGARVGYQSQSHFTKIFKDLTGLTPNAYRVAGVKLA